MDERIEMRGGVLLQLVDRHGEVVHEQRQDNRIVRSGRRLVAELFGGVSGGALPSRVSHMAVGTDGTAATDDQLGLLAQRGGRKPFTEVTYTDLEETAPGGGIVRRVRASVTAVFDFDEANDTTVPLREAGIFNAASAGVMYNRVVFEPVTKTNSFRLTLLWDIVF